MTMIVINGQMYMAVHVVVVHSSSSSSSSSRFRVVIRRVRLKNDE